MLSCHAFDDPDMLFMNGVEETLEKIFETTVVPPIFVTDIEITAPRALSGTKIAKKTTGLKDLLRYPSRT